MKKTFTCIAFYTAGENSSKLKDFLVKNLKTGINQFNPGHQEAYQKLRLSW